jgi:hypothetical protein
MELRVSTGGQLREAVVEALLCRVECDAAKLGEVLWPRYKAGFLAFTAEEQRDIVAALEAAHLPYRVLPAEQPEPAALATLQGRVATRSEALARLAPHWLECSAKAARGIGRAHNAVAHGIVAFDDAERDAISAELAAAGEAYEQKDGQPVPTTVEELKARIVALESKATTPVG